MTARLIIILAIIAALGSAAVWIYQQGGKAVVIETERQNNAAGNLSDKARSAYDKCSDAGRLYDFATGKCGGLAPSRRN